MQGYSPELQGLVPQLMACLFCVVVVCLVFLFSVVVVGVLFWFSLFFFHVPWGMG